jgi:probable HAF family extracellular repeat protein
MTLLRSFVLSLILLICVPLTYTQSAPAIAQAHLTFTTIDVPGAEVNGVSGINSAGDMVGYYGPNNGSGLDKHGFLYRDGTFTFLDYPSADSTFAFGINDSGLIVGSAEFSGGSLISGFTYDGLTYSPLRVKGKSSTITYAVNNSGHVVGGAGTLYSTKGFQESNGKFKTLNVPGQYVYIFASGINSFDRVVGWGDEDGFVCRNGACQILDVPGASQTAARGINDGGVIVGWYASSTCICAFALKNGKYLSFSYPGAGGTFADAINASGQVVGQYTFDYQSYHGFVTSPLTAVDIQ